MENEVVAILKNMLDTLGVSYGGVTRKEIAGQAIFSIEAGDARALIGARGDTVHALDHLVKKIIEHRLDVRRRSADESGASPERDDSEESQESERGPLFLVDVNDYRAKQIQDLQNKALMLAERARSFQYDVELSPMSAYERLIIHTALQNAPNIKTESQGEGRNRRVVIKYSAGM